MLNYPHFSVPNLYLQSGYEVHRTPDGDVHTYSSEDRLEQCVRRVLLRKPARLRGWDLRFLRRGLELSQAQFGKMIERDAQTVARWEKSKRQVPKLADLAIRCRFAERFEPSMSVRELASYVDGKASKLPTFILLTFDGSDWSYSFRPLFTYLQREAITRADVILPRGPGATQIVYVSQSRGMDIWEKAAGAGRFRRPGITLWQPQSSPLYESMPLIGGTTPMLEIKSTQSADERTNEIKH
jgi:DNA-binding transcriptional regulator YiaG